MSLSIAAINALSRDEFIQRLGGVFEHSPWVAETAFAKRPFADVAGLKPGREREDETILFWHRGLSLSDIALGFAMLRKAQRLGIGQRLRFH